MNHTDKVKDVSGNANLLFPDSTTPKRHGDIVKIARSYLYPTSAPKSFQLLQEISTRQTIFQATTIYLFPLDISTILFLCYLAYNHMIICHMTSWLNLIISFWSKIQWERYYRFYKWWPSLRLINLFGGFRVFYKIYLSHPVKIILRVQHDCT